MASAALAEETRGGGCVVKVLLTPLCPLLGGMDPMKWMLPSNGMDEMDPMEWMEWNGRKGSNGMDGMDPMEWMELIQWNGWNRFRGMDGRDPMKWMEWIQCHRC
ncbi:hypothetical protein CDAR_167671 [Caerostris darwini]|uniref:Uncharacterized protein n=1 Tax=Caerostris darwini TaxID=1538125 RepID=A0AAV4M8R4_9ARAC|nr:hypothetical protein CDAR_167671 [Caerostris darwini]